MYLYNSISYVYLYNTNEASQFKIFQFNSATTKKPEGKFYIDSKIINLQKKF